MNIQGDGFCFAYSQQAAGGDIRTDQSGGEPTTNAWRYQAGVWMDEPEPEEEEEEEELSVRVAASSLAAATVALMAF